MDRFEELGVFVVAVSQEEEDLSRVLDMARKTGVRFPLVHDVGRATTPRLDRTHGYLVDGDGVVRQIFPMSAYMRPSADVVLAEIERILGADEAEEGSTAPDDGAR